MAALTSSPHVTFFMSVWIFTLAADHHEVTVKAGEDVTLQCQAPRDAQINMFEWIRSDLESDGYIFRFIPEESTTRNQLPSYRGRVERRDPDMKDGDLSVVLKNVRVKDTGTYRCRVGISGGEKPKVYSTIQLTVSDHHEVTVKAGENVTLQCQAPRDAQINMLEWIRPDLESGGHIFRFIPEESTTQNQHSSYRGRVERRDPDMKDGDLSVVLKNVRVNDTGTYRCRVGISGGEKPKVYSTIQLIVSGASGARGNGGLAAGVVFLVVTVAAVVGPDV
ncbi:coxsackievirus and adenovirus receptor homolog [Sander lucioperca]|uniref:coxsackievirus and adenovirus receptor homolog n=1 Tax=Sander lucioperca TaxID=283035 RepID=UPI00165358EA|nr:coxsackievirus and adenovirus receptor homolog [Sander lucioperca]